MKEYNYSSILEIYKSNLLNKLRDFKVNDDLALWVPNDDITESVINLIDSVDETEIKIFFDDQQFKNLNIKYLNQSIKDEGEIITNNASFFLIFKRLSKNKKIILKKVKKKNVLKFKDKLTPNNDNELLQENYYNNLKNIEVSNNFSKKISKLSSLTDLKYEDENCHIEILVNPTNHYIVDAFLQTKKNIPEINLFSKFLLDSMINLPIDEVKDHLLLKLEYFLRPKVLEKNKGIILKNRGGTIFMYFQKIINDFFFQYQKKNNVKFGINFYNYEIPEEWKKLKQIDKIKKIKEILKKFNLELGKSEEDHFTIDNLIASNRLFLKMGKNLLKSNKNQLFFELEKFLNKNLNIKFEVYYVNRLDENQLRN